MTSADIGFGATPREGTSEGGPSLLERAKHFPAVYLDSGLGEGHLNRIEDHPQ